MALERMRSEGFDRGFWVFVEKRLHDTVVAVCPHCADKHITHFFWNSFECSGCDKKVRFRDCAAIEVRPVGENARISMNTVEFV